MALEALNDDNVRKQVQQRITELSLRDVEEEKAKAELMEKYDRPKWSKHSQRQSIQTRESPLRKTRQELRKMGSKVEGHMDYSWQGRINAIPRRRSTRDDSDSSEKDMHVGPTARKEWAKVQVAVKTADRDGAAIRKTKAELGVH